MSPIPQEVKVTLLPCPHDGGAAFIEVDHEEFDIARAYCNVCGACGPFVDLSDFSTVKAAKAKAAELWNTRSTPPVAPGEVVERVASLLATVDVIECVPMTHPFPDDDGRTDADPIWRIELDGYCADFEHSEAANNFALAINSRIERAASGIDEAIEVVSEIEAANDHLCGLRTDEQYQSMLAAGQQDALERLDQARRRARAFLHQHGRG